MRLNIVVKSVPIIWCLLTEAIRCDWRSEVSRSRDPGATVVNQYRHYLREAETFFSEVIRDDNILAALWSAAPMGSCRDRWEHSGQVRYTLYQMERHIMLLRDHFFLHLAPLAEDTSLVSSEGSLKQTLEDLRCELRAVISADNPADAMNRFVDDAVWIERFILLESIVWQLKTQRGTRRVPMFAGIDPFQGYGETIGIVELVESMGDISNWIDGGISGSLRSTRTRLGRLHQSISLTLDSLGLTGEQESSRISLNSRYPDLRNELFTLSGNLADSNLCGDLIKRFVPNESTVLEYAKTLYRMLALMEIVHENIVLIAPSCQGYRGPQRVSGTGSIYYQSKEMTECLSFMERFPKQFEYSQGDAQYVRGVLNLSESIRAIHVSMFSTDIVVVNYQPSQRGFTHANIVYHLADLLHDLEMALVCLSVKESVSRVIMEKLSLLEGLLRRFLANGATHPVASEDRIGPASFANLSPWQASSLSGVQDISSYMSLLVHSQNVLYKISSAASFGVTSRERIQAKERQVGCTSAWDLFARSRIGITELDALLRVFIRVFLGNSDEFIANAGQSRAAVTKIALVGSTESLLKGMESVLSKFRRLSPSEYTAEGGPILNAFIQDKNTVAALHRLYGMVQLIQDTTGTRYPLFLSDSEDGLRLLSSHQSTAKVIDRIANLSGLLGGVSIGREVYELFASLEQLKKGLGVDTSIASDPAAGSALEQVNSVSDWFRESNFCVDLLTRFSPHPEDVEAYKAQLVRLHDSLAAAIEERAFQIAKMSHSGLPLVRFANPQVVPQILRRLDQLMKAMRQIGDTTIWVKTMAMLELLTWSIISEDDSNLLRIVHEMIMIDSDEEDDHSPDLDTVVVQALASFTANLSKNLPRLIVTLDTRDECIEWAIQLYSQIRRGVPGLRGWRLLSTQRARFIQTPIPRTFAPLFADLASLGFQVDSTDIDPSQLVVEMLSSQDAVEGFIGTVDFSSMAVVDFVYALATASNVDAAVQTGVRGALTRLTSPQGRQLMTLWKNQILLKSDYQSVSQKVFELLPPGGLSELVEEMLALHDGTDGRMLLDELTMWEFHNRHQPDELIKVVPWSDALVRTITALWEEGFNLPAIRETAGLTFEGIEELEGSRESFRVSEQSLRMYLVWYPILYPRDIGIFCRVLEEFRGLLGPDLNSMDSARMALYRSSFFWKKLSIHTVSKYCPRLVSARQRVQRIEWEMQNRFPVMNKRRIELNVERNQLFGSTLEMLRSTPPQELATRPIRVSFIGESGSDEGGLKREWYSLVTREFLESHDLFEETFTGSNKFKIRAGLDEHQQGMLTVAGRFIAKAILDKQPIPAYFTRYLYRCILSGFQPDVPVQLEDFRDELPFSEFKIYEQLLAQEQPEEVLRDMTFSVDFMVKRKRRKEELLEGGAHKQVTNENKHEYVQLLMEYKIKTSIRDPMTKFLEGFHSLIPKELLAGRFSAGELESLISGISSIDLADLRAHTTYTGYTDDDEQVEQFWEILDLFSDEQKTKFLKFVTGSPQVPLGGFANLREGANGNPSHFVIQRGPESSQLPTAHTCFNILVLPVYGDAQELELKLTQAIEDGNEGFGFE